MGYGNINDEKTEMKSINTFESPSIFEKKLKWTFTLFMKKDIDHQEDVILSKVNLMIDGKKVSLKETILDEYNKNKHKRTLVFEKVGENLELDMQRIKYKEVYNQIIDIPID